MFTKHISITILVLLIIYHLEIFRYNFLLQLLRFKQNKKLKTFNNRKESFIREFVKEANGYATFIDWKYLILEKCVDDIRINDIITSSMRIDGTIQNAFKGLKKIDDSLIISPKVRLLQSEIYKKVFRKYFQIELSDEDSYVLSHYSDPSSVCYIFLKYCNLADIDHFTSSQLCKLAYSVKYFIKVIKIKMLLQSMQYTGKIGWLAIIIECIKLKNISIIDKYRIVKTMSRNNNYLTSFPKLSRKSQQVIDIQISRKENKYFFKRKYEIYQFSYEIRRFDIVSKNRISIAIQCSRMANQIERYLIKNKAQQLKKIFNIYEKYCKLIIESD